jgi:hypothetical protein
MTWWNSTDQLARLSISVQWLLIAFAVCTAGLTVVKLVVGNRLDELKAEKSSRQAEELQDARKRLLQTQEALRATHDKVDALETSTLPRRLNDLQTARLRAALSRFSGQRVDITSHDHDNESQRFRFDLEAALRAAGWNVGHTIPSGLHLKPGMWIWYEPGSHAEVAAKQLVASLQAFGFQIHVMEGIGDKELILMSTGRKSD